MRLFSPYKFVESWIEDDKNKALRSYEKLKITRYGRFINFLKDKQVYKENKKILRVVIGQLPN